MQEVKRDIGTFRRLHGRERWQFVWDYFRFKIIVAVFAIFVICLFANLLWQGQKPYRLRICVVLNNDQYCDSWFENFKEDLSSDGQEGDIDLNQDQPFDYDNSYYYVQEMEVMTTVSSQRMDVAICGPDMYDYLLALNACTPLDTVLPSELTEELKTAGSLIESTANIKQDDEGNPDTSEAVTGYYAIDLSDTDFGQCYNGDQELEDGESPAPLYAVIISNTKHMEDSVKLLQALCR